MTDSKAAKTMGPKAIEILEAYERALVDIAQRLAGSDDPNEAAVGARLLVCAACNRRTYDQPCGNCEMGQDLGVGDSLRASTPKG
jgi:hypothetical protein